MRKMCLLGLVLSVATGMVACQTTAEPIAVTRVVFNTVEETVVQTVEQVVVEEDTFVTVEVTRMATPPPLESQAELASENITLEIWLAPRQACMAETVVDAFNAQSDTVFVQPVMVQDILDASQAILSGRPGPDIVSTPGTPSVIDLVNNGGLLSLDEQAGLLDWYDRFAPFALNSGVISGHLYSLPDEMETLVLYYNKTLFEAHNWPLPTTMDELHLLAGEIAAAGIIPFAHANLGWQPTNEWYVSEYLNHVAGPDKVYQALTGQLEWTDPDFVLAIEMLAQAQQNGWYMGGLDAYYSTPWNEWHDALATGAAAMSIEGTWSAAEINNVYFTPRTGGNEWAWIPIPASTDTTIFDVGIGNTWSINADTAHPQAAAQFLDFLFSEEAQAARFADCGIALAPISLTEDALAGTDPRIANIFEMLAAAVASGDYGYTTWTFWPPESNRYMYEEIERVWAGDITALEYLEGLNELFQEELAAGAVPPIPPR